MNQSGLKKCRTLRDFMLDIHAWMGAVAALFILSVSITGIALTFSGPLMKFETGALSVSGQRTAPVNLEALIAKSKAEAGKTFLPVGYLGPNAEIVTKADMIYGMSDMPGNGGEEQIISFDPASDEVTGVFYLHRTFTHKLIDFHYTLLAGNAGLFLIAIIGLLMTLLALMGLWLWWPGRGRVWKKAKKTTLKGPWITKSFRLHGLSGFWLSLAVLLWGISGTYWSKPDWFPEDFMPQTDRMASALPSEFTDATCDGDVSVNEAVSLALNQYPKYRILEAEFAAPWQNYHVLYLAQPEGIDHMDADTRVWVHAQCKNLIVSQSLSGVGKTGAVMQGLHSGRIFGALRVPVLILIGSALILMSITGLHLWWVRVFRTQG